MQVRQVTKRLEISGVVQGVGFRPFLFVLARDYRLNGEVSNTASGVSVLVEGRPEDIEGFRNDVRNKAPLLASVTQIKTFDSDPGGFSSFKIVKSRTSGSRATLISPDVTVCRDCLDEMNDPDDRRYRYPFINCTNCGPRYTIIEDIPYDRPKTSMKVFPMCAQCRHEYDDPMNRRFHAQPNACPECGPKVFLTDNQGNRADVSQAEAITLAAEYLKQGKILAVKGLGGFHLACDAANPEAVRNLRQRKNRPHKPFALMAESASALFDHVMVSDREKELLTSYHRPIVLLRKKEKGEGLIKGIANEVAPFNSCLGVMLPYTPLHHLLLAKGPEVLVMTSGNRSGEPLSIDNADALDAFSHIADYFLLHDRDIYFRADDSIARVQEGRTRFIRRSRGYAPLPVFLNQKLPNILGCGAGLKNTICLTRESYAFLSPHIGDLESVKNFEFFKDTVAHLKKILDISPGIIAHDMHPGYDSTQYAVECASGSDELKAVAVQHHHAHAAACMAENDLKGQVIAITLDGTGYGTDGRIWGGEVLVCTYADFERRAHLSYIPMPGGDAAVLSPWRMAASVLYTAFGRAFLDLDIPYLKQMEKEKLLFLCQMMEKKLNSPLTSSAGRLFDAVSSLLCICHEISHESQAAMELEAIAQINREDLINQEDPTGREEQANRKDPDDPGDPVKEGYGFEIGTDDREEGGCYRIDMMPAVREVVADLESGTSREEVSLKFHLAMARAFCEAAFKVSLETGLDRVVLSGGVFYNDLVLRAVIQGLEHHGLTVYTHTKVPTGDGGISLGQAVVAAALEGNG